jgi:hypothetical protein
MTIIAFRYQQYTLNVLEIAKLQEDQMETLCVGGITKKDLELTQA